RDPDRAVIEHASAAVLQGIHLTALLAGLILVDQGRLHALGGGQNVLLEGAERARAGADLAEERFEVVRGADLQLVAGPALEAEGSIALEPKHRSVLRPRRRLHVVPGVGRVAAAEAHLALPFQADHYRRRVLARDPDAEFAVAAACGWVAEFRQREGCGLL